MCITAACNGAERATTRKRDKFRGTYAKTSLEAFLTEKYFVYIPAGQLRRKKMGSVTRTECQNGLASREVAVKSPGTLPEALFSAL
jgi:hypothetical protein